MQNKSAASSSAFSYSPLLYLDGMKILSPSSSILISFQISPISLDSVTEFIMNLFVNVISSQIFLMYSANEKSHPSFHLMLIFFWIILHNPCNEGSFETDDNVPIKVKFSPFFTYIESSALQ